MFLFHICALLCFPFSLKVALLWTCESSYNGSGYMFLIGKFGGFQEKDVVSSVLAYVMHLSIFSMTDILAFLPLV